MIELYDRSVAVPRNDEVLNNVYARRQLGRQ